MNRGLQILIILSIFFTGLMQALAKPTIQEFKQDIIAHKNRVIENSLIIFNQFPQYFPRLSKLPKDIQMDFIMTYLAVHDAPKTMSLEQLSELGYRGEKTILEKLHENWGKDLKRRPPFIQTLNDLEEIYKSRVMASKFESMDQSLFGQILLEVQWMEFIADETDAKIKRGAELGFEIKPFDAYNMMKEFYHDQSAADVSKWLEIHQYKQGNLIFCEDHFKSGR